MDRLASRAIRHRFLVLTLVGFLMYVPFLGMRDMWYPDEPCIGGVTQAMYVSGDWVTPKRVGEAWVDYPPLLYWAGASSAHLFGGISEFALRLPNALAAIAIAILTCWAGSLWFDPRAGLWAGFALLTFHKFFYQAINFRPDVLFGLGIVAGVVLYAEGVGERPRWYLRVAGFAMLGVAMLAKGPLGLLLTGLVLVLWLGSRREWLRVLELAPLSVVALAVYLPWFVACAKSMGADDIVHELWAQNFARFGSGFRGHAQPFYYYVQVLAFNLLPWVPMLPFAIWGIVRGKLRGERNVQLLLWWFGTFVVFLSLAVTKRAIYLLPAWPAVALLLAPWLAEVGRKESRSDVAPSAGPARIYSAVLTFLLPFFGLLLIGLAAGVETIISREEFNDMMAAVSRDLRAPLVAMGLLLIAGGVWIGLAWRKGNPREALIRLGAIHIPVVILLMGWLLPTMNPIKTYKPQGRWVAQEIGPERRFAMVYPELGHHKREGFVYYSGKLVSLLETTEEVEAFLRERPESVVLVHETWVDAIFEPDEARWRSRVIHQLRTREDTYLVVR